MGERGKTTSSYLIDRRRLALFAAFAGSRVELGTAAVTSPVGTVRVTVFAVPPAWIRLLVPFAANCNTVRWLLRHPCTTLLLQRHSYRYRSIRLQSLRLGRQYRWPVCLHASPQYPHRLLCLVTFSEPFATVKSLMAIPSVSAIGTSPGAVVRPVIVDTEISRSVTAPAIMKVTVSPERFTAVPLLSVTEPALVVRLISPSATMLPRSKLPVVVARFTSCCASAPASFTVIDVIVCVPPLVRTNRTLELLVKVPKV